jgi:hypothetical protein
MSAEHPATPPVPAPAPEPPTSNGETLTRNLPNAPGSSRLPKGGRRWSNRWRIGVGVAALLVFGAAITAVLGVTGVLFGKQPYSGPTWTVRKEKLKITIVARGSLESANNGDIYCKVRSGTKGSTIATTIKTVVDAGIEVSEGDEVMVLDFSGFEEQKKDKTKDVNQAYAAKVQADQQVEIQKFTNENDKLLAKNKLTLAEIDERKYKEGDYIQALKDVEGRTKTAESDLEDWKDRAGWSNRMAKKGLMSKVQADADASRLDASRIALEKLIEEKRVLVEYTKPRTETDLQTKVAEAILNVKKTEQQANFTLEYLEADRETKRAIYDLETSRLKEIDAQIDECRVKSPQSGLVVYYVPEQVRGGGGAQQSIVAQGEPVREGQKMLQIPDLNNMLVNVRVPEAFVAHLQEKDKKDKNKDKGKDRNKGPIVSSSDKEGGKWLRAMVKVDAFQYFVLNGHVKFVDTVASTQDWFAADVKVYKTLVAIDAHTKFNQRSLDELAKEEIPELVLDKLAALKDREWPNRNRFLADVNKVLSRREVMRYESKVAKHAEVEQLPQLRPGMSAEVTITADESTDPVLVVPVQAVLGTISSGADRKVFVVGSDGFPVLRDIKVGMSNERLVEVTAGLAEGERVVENPRPLLEEGSELRPARGGAGGPGDKGKGGGAPGGDKKGGTPGGPGGGQPGGGKQGPPAGGKGNVLAPQLLPPGIERPAVAAVERQPALNKM